MDYNKTYNERFPIMLARSAYKFGLTGINLAFLQKILEA